MTNLVGDRGEDRDQNPDQHLAQKPAQNKIRRTRVSALH